MEQWRPDDHLIDSARAGNLCALKMPEIERSWVVAGLTRLGLTADETADLLGCSLRLIRQIRASPITHLASHTLDLVDTIDGCARRALDAERRAERDTSAALIARDRAVRLAECLATVRDLPPAQQPRCTNPRCRHLVVQPARGRRRKFCSNRCRYEFRYVDTQQHETATG